MKLYFAVALTFALQISVLCGQDTSSAPFVDKMLPALFNEQVQAELELVDDQRKQLKTVLSDVQKMRDELSRELEEYRDSGATASELLARRDTLILDFEKIKADFQQKAVAILLPHQQKRLREVTVQYMMRETARNSQQPTGLLAPPMRDYLEINDEQAQRIRDRATKLQQELTEKIRELTEQAHKDLITELNQNQRKKYMDLIGDRLR